MGTNAMPLQQPDLGKSYEDLYNILKRMYWEASTLECKDEVHGVMEEVGDIIDQLDEQSLEDNTASFASLQPKIAAANAALQKVSSDVAKITKNISTAANAVAAISKILALVPKLP